MFSYLIRKFKKEEGQAVVELALTLPILIMILCAIVDFGWIFNNQIMIDNCSREGARYAIVHSTETIASIKGYTRSVAPAYLTDVLTINVIYDSGNVTVDVNGGVDVLTPLAGVFTQGQTLDLSSSCTMKVE
ncbi:TadE/TadG family type IV pilus assembly protein [Acetobacterium bakii]|uniref:TadE/TadG family type IV pilus assembly protein n=1 Tax=Acetobacterium bakii TaxID=52689 RepID=UPI0006833149|nr:TadE/TadG family type IV pilus assembly protein [Acetobacterium bakii]